MKYVGQVKELWRYPVSSLGGQRCDHIEIDAHGLKGDRKFGIFDPATMSVATPEKEARWRPALFLESTLDGNGNAYVRLPDGSQYRVEDGALISHLSDHFGFSVAIGRYAHIETERFKSLPIISNRYVPSALHLLTTSSIATLSEMTPTVEVDRRRFRPSVLMTTENDLGFIENEWVGSVLRIGELRVGVTEKTKRCGMTFIAQPQLLDQPEILRNIVRQNGRNMGVYCEPLRPGSISVGMNVYLEA
jgi:uncharacterized protein YcbX